MTGLEPVTSSLPRKCSTAELHWHSFLLGAEDEAQTRDPQLGRLMLYQLSYFRIFLWAKMDSNHRRRKPADLQSAPFGHSGICPYISLYKTLNLHLTPLPHTSFLFRRMHPFIKD